MKKNRVIALLLCLMMTFSFVACGQKAPADADSKPAVEEETKTEEELRGLLLRLWEEVRGQEDSE